MLIHVFLEPHGIFGSYFLNHMVCLDQVVHTYLFKHCPATGMQNGDEAAERILINQTIYVRLKNMQIEIINNNTILETWYRNFVGPKGVYYIHYARPSVGPIYFLHKNISSGSGY